jgi:hypothetical protein
VRSAAKNRKAIEVVGREEGGTTVNDEAKVDISVRV